MAVGLIARGSDKGVMRLPRALAALALAAALGLLAAPAAAGPAVHVRTGDLQAGLEADSHACPPGPQSPHCFVLVATCQVAVLVVPLPGGALVEIVACRAL
jgi:hypothetical protein